VLVNSEYTVDQNTLPEEFVAFSSFASTASAVVSFLRRALKLHLWLVTRIVDDQWIVLHTFGEGALRAGDVVDVGRTLCQQMIDGRGPNIAPEVSCIPSYAAVALPKSIGDVGAYVGAPIMMSDGGLFGTLCACDPAPQRKELELQRPLLMLQARLLSTVLEQELAEDRLRRRAERAERDALVDPLTGLVNRRGWERAVFSEEERGTRYGHPATVVMLDLDGLKYVNDSAGHAEGDRLLCRTAAILRETSRENDVVARLGGDEFGALLVESDTLSGRLAYERLKEKLIEAGVAASVGIAQRRAGAGLLVACKEADIAMYALKRQRAYGSHQQA